MASTVDTTKKRVCFVMRQDIIAWFLGLVFLGILIGMIYAVGNAREWDAISGYTHNETMTSQDRFLSEPYVQEQGVRGRYGSGATARWYYWKLKPELLTFWTHFFPWIGYVLHQVFIWGAIYYAQLQKAYEPPGQAARYSTNMKAYNWVAFTGNAFFHLLHFICTHVTYDGLAPDVSISTSQASVIMILIFIIVIEYNERGLAFFWPTRANEKQCSIRARLDYGPVYLVRRFHGYAFAWGATYTFWYHPMENTMGHVLGFCHTWFILLQGSLMYTDFHLNRYWRLLQEVWVVLHGGVVAWQTGGPDKMGTALWPMFVFGFGLCFVVTQVFSLPFWSHPRCHPALRILPLLGYLAAAIYCYSWIPDDDGNVWIRMTEIIRIPPVYYIGFLIAWALCFGFLAIDRKVKSKAVAAEGIKDVAERQTKVGTGKTVVYIFGFFMVYAVHVGLAVWAQYGDWAVDMIILMVVFVVIYTLGVAVSTMFLKQIIPYKLHRESDVDQSIATDITQNGFPLGHAGDHVNGHVVQNGGEKSHQIILGDMNKGGEVQYTYDNMAYNEKL